MNTNAGKLEQLGRQSDNAVWQDLANLSAQYRRAIVLSLPTYRLPTDNHLANAATYAFDHYHSARAQRWACPSVASVRRC